MPQQQIREDLLCRACGGDRPHQLVGWNEIGKPVYACREPDCDEQRVGPLDARTKQARTLATDGGQR